MAGILSHCLYGLKIEIKFVRVFPGGPYGVFAGRDASRGLATMTLNDESVRDEYDDLSGLSELELEEMREWQQTFKSGRRIEMGNFFKTFS